MLWAVLQFALPAAATAADARVERESRMQVVHVESDSTSACRPVHAAECALCQLITHDAGAPVTASLPLIAATLPCGVVTEQVSSATQALGELPPARAPPIV
jgi:deoxycytidylate deaminase